MQVLKGQQRHNKAIVNAKGPVALISSGPPPNVFGNIFSISGVEAKELIKYHTAMH